MAFDLVGRREQDRAAAQTLPGLEALSIPTRLQRLGDCIADLCRSSGRRRPCRSSQVRKSEIIQGIAMVELRPRDVTLLDAQRCERLESDRARRSSGFARRQNMLPQRAP